MGFLTLWSLKLLHVSKAALALECWIQFYTSFSVVTSSCNIYERWKIRQGSSPPPPKFQTKPEYELQTEYVILSTVITIMYQYWNFCPEIFRWDQCLLGDWTKTGKMHPPPPKKKTGKKIAGNWTLIWRRLCLNSNTGHNSELFLALCCKPPNCERLKHDLRFTPPTHKNLWKSRIYNFANWIKNFQLHHHTMDCR